jgi:DNA-binding transcriptional regulator YdaS (Cro superfamily)
MMWVMNAIDQAIKHLGGVSKLADAIGVGQSAISNLATRGGTPSPANCLSIERATDGAVTRQDLRPDDYWLIWPDLPAPKRTKTAKAA